MTLGEAIQSLTNRILLVCPIIGVCVPDINDKETWRIDYDPSATDSQKAAAQAVIAGFDMLALPVPQSVTRWRFLRALRETSYGNGTLYDAVSGAISAANSPALTNAWNEVGEFVRDSAVLAQLADGLGLTSGQVDDLFRLADSFAP